MPDQKQKPFIKEGQLLIQCSVCKNFKLEDESWGLIDYFWLEKYSISHGYCRPCFEKEIKKQQANRKKHLKEKQ